MDTDREGGDARARVATISILETVSQLRRTMNVHSLG